MSYIQIDSRGCGQGKTVNTIIPRIRQNIKNKTKTLLVVPSIDLQKEYLSHFMFDEITIINSNHGKIFDQYQTASTPVVCMTHEGFLRTPITEKANVDLIIDEAFIPYYSETFKNFDSAGRIMIDFSEIVSWHDPVVNTIPKPTVKPQPFFELDIIKSTPANTVNRALWHKLTNPNIKLWATWETGNNLMNNARETCTLQLELNPEILKGWQSVWIAAAVFEKTLMAMWLDSNNISYEVQHKFKTHKLPVVWHFPHDGEGFSWSKNFRKNHPEIETLFRDYVESNRTGELIYNKNKDSDVVFVFGKEISHNAHGINQYRHLTDYAFLSAIKPHPQFKNFIKDRTGSGDRELEFSFAGYMAYQLVMRTALRDPNNTTPVNLFFLDTEQMLGIMDLFHPDYYKTQDITTILGNKKKPLSPAEKMKRYRSKKTNKTDI